jgi:outer membrane protein OmpA-like peptidoglycan-associated protein
MGKAMPISMGFAIRFSFGAGDRYSISDSLKWVREIMYRDSLLDDCYALNKTLRDSLALATQQVETLLDSLIECRGTCMAQDMSRDQLRKQADSLAEARLKAELALMRERARLDSIARAEQLERDRAARLADFRKKAEAFSSGLDDYKVTQTVPSERARERLDVAAELMQDYPDLMIRITGHTCDKGTHEANMRFGMQRAESAKNYMVIKGINPSRITINSKAELEPIRPNVNEENRRKNRRVQLEIIQGGEQLKQEVK